MTLHWNDPAARQRWRSLVATPRLLVALDFDGTVSELGDVPMAVRAVPRAAEAISRLSARDDTVVAFVSGRTLTDLREIAEHVDASPVWLAGSHGAEFWEPGVLVVADEATAAVGVERTDELTERDRLIAEAEAAVVDLPGVWIEPKRYGFATHTRLATRADAERAQRATDQLVAAQAPGWRRRAGHDVREYAFRHEGKDTAIARLRERIGATAVIFAGDDVTDEDALRSLNAGDLGVRVGEGETTAALRADDPHDLAAFLDALASERDPRRE